MPPTPTMTMPTPNYMTMSAPMTAMSASAAMSATAATSAAATSAAATRHGFRCIKENRQKHGGPDSQCKS